MFQCVKLIQTFHSASKSNLTSIQLIPTSVEDFMKSMIHIISILINLEPTGTHDQVRCFQVLTLSNPGKSERGVHPLIFF